MNTKQTYWQYLAANPLKIVWMTIVIGIALSFMIYSLTHLKEALETPIWALMLVSLLAIGMIIGAFAQTYSEYKQANK